MPHARVTRIVLGVGVGLLMLVPAIVVIARFAGRPWLPVADFGIIDFRVRDVWSLHTPLTGLYSRPGWNHPGPMMFWLMGLVSAPAGGASWATRISGAVIQGVAVGWLAWVTWRRGFRMFLAAATVTALSYLALEPAVFTEPWNPNIPVSCFILFLFLTCLAADGQFRQLIAMSIVGNVVLQTHVSYASLVVVCIAWVVGCAIWDARRSQQVPPGWRSTVMISAAVWIVTWSFPIIDVVVNWPGNLGKVAHYFVLGHHPTVGLRPAAGIMADEFRWVPNWLGGATHLDYAVYAHPASLLWLLVPVVMLGLGFIAARRVGSRSDARMVGLAAVLLLVGIVAISNADESRAYTFQWRIVLAAFIVVSSVWAIAAYVERRAPHGWRYVALGVVLAVVAWGTLDLGIAVSSSAENTGLEVRGPALGTMMDQLHREGLPKHQVVLLGHTRADLPSLFQGLVDELDRSGVDIRVEPGAGRIFGTQRTATVAQADAIWTVTEQGSYIPELADQPGARIIANASPLTRQEEAEITRLQRQLLARLAHARIPHLHDVLDSSLVAYALKSVPGIDQRAVDRLAILNRKVERSGGCRCALVARPA